MKGDTEVVVGILLFFGGVAWKSFSEGEDISWMITALVAPAATLVAAYVGAKLAFDYNKKEKKHLEFERRHGSIGVVIFELQRLLDMFNVVEKQFIAPHRTNHDRHLMIQPATRTGWHRPTFDFSALAFLISTPEKNILRELSLLELDIDSTIDVMNQRSELHVEKLQPAVEQAEKIHGTNLTVADIVQQLGRKNNSHLLTTTDALIQGIDSGILAINATIAKIEQIRLDNTARNGTA
jgi:hypothetical protein